MQFHLETDELNLLANVLLERVSATSTRASSASHRKSDSDAEQDPRHYNDLLDKVLARDLRFDFDELQQVANLLAGKKRSLRDEIARQPNAVLKTELQREQALLERVLERVAEACAMV